MIRRLRLKGFGDEEVEGALQFLKNNGLIEDRTLANELFRSALLRKNLGKKGIESFLFKRGIDKELIRETLSKHTPDMEKESALNLVQKKLKVLDRYPERVKRRRILGALQRRGFSSDVIRQAVQSTDL
jgi:regulatory protein